MVVSFEITNKYKHELTVTDLTVDTDQYKDEFSHIDSFYRFKYSETKTINCLEYVSSKGAELISVRFNQHDTHLDETHFEINRDGYYNVTHIILPTVEWYQHRFTHEMWEEYDSVYLTDGKIIYHVDYHTGRLVPVDVKEVMLINTYHTTISRGILSVFTLYNLWECYINMANNWLNNVGKDCGCTGDENSQFKKDFLWTTINVLKYYIDFEEYEKALMTLESIFKCGDELCRTYNIGNNNVGCGCKKTGHPIVPGRH